MFCCKKLEYLGYLHAREKVRTELIQSETSLLLAEESRVNKLEIKD